MNYELLNQAQHMTVGREKTENCDVPPDDKSRNTCMYCIVSDLTDRLAAETQRRVAAEAVADWIVKRPSIYGATDALDMANEYRAEHPKEPAKDSDMLDIPAFLRRGDD